jgi:hypothetical protein
MRAFLILAVVAAMIPTCGNDAPPDASMGRCEGCFSHVECCLRLNVCGECFFDAGVPHDAAADVAAD